MKLPIIFAASSASGAAIEIIVMLLVAAIIGFLTAYFYYRSKWKNGAVDQADVDSLRSENSRLEKELVGVRELYKKAVAEIDDTMVELKNTKDELEEKDEVLVRIASRKHLLNYDSFGTASEEEKDDLKMIGGIGPFIETKLHALDIYTFRQISRFDEEDIKTVTEAIEFFPGRIERDHWVEQATELVHSHGKETDVLANIRKKKSLINFDRIGVSKKEDADDLTVISGIGGFIQKKLNALDIYTYQQIANFNKEDEEIVTKAIEFFPGRIERDEWVAQAKELSYSGGDRTELFERMKQRKHKINYSVIGVAHREDADDLTAISGIGDFIQEKLNAIDIYTFEQISRFTAVEEETVTEVIEFFPGRIKRDKWVAQSKKLAAKK